MLIFEKILEVSLLASAREPERNSEFVLMKVAEELGEIATAAYFSQEEPLEGEVADFIITLVDLLFITHDSSGTDKERIDSLISIITQSMTIPVLVGNMDPIRWLIDRNVMTYQSADRFPSVVQAHGMMNKSLNQPWRCPRPPVFYIGLCIRTVVEFVSAFKVGQEPGELYHVLSKQVDKKLAKWKSKADL